MTAEVRREDDGTVTLITTCPLCSKPAQVSGLDPDAFMKWRQGMMVQSAFPGLSLGDRETLISGCHEDCFDSAFQDE